MQSKLTIKAIIEWSLNANFENVLKIMHSKQIQVETNSAIKIIVAICNACHKNLSTPENINDQNLLQLLKCLIKFIKIPSNENFESYAQSGFHILKMLMEKKSFKCILQLEEFFIPEFMPLILTEKHITIYESICKCLYNVIIRTCQAKDRRNSDEMLKLSYLLSSLYRKLDKKTNLFESAHNCLLSLVNLGVSSNKLLELYQHVICLIDRTEDSSMYPVLMNNFSFMFTHLMKNENYDLASTCFKTTKNQFCVFFKGKEFCMLWDIVEVVEWLNPVSENVSTQPTKSHDSLKNYFRVYKSSESLQAVCDFISSVASTVLQIHKKTNDWIRVDKHIPYYNFLNDIALIMAKTPYSCPCKNCVTNTNLNEALRTLNTVGGLGRLYITNKKDISRNYKQEILRYLEKFTSHVLQLKENKCEKWKKHWYDLGVHLYSIGVHLSQNEDAEMSVIYLQKFIHTLLEFEGPQAKIIDKSYLNSAFNSVGNIYFENGNYERCLLVTSLSIIFNESPKTEINRWIRAKAMSREKTIEENRELQELTLVSICSVYRNELLKFIPETGLKLDIKKKIELLTYELRQYNLKWKSKIPMSSVFKGLSQIANAQYVAEIFIEIWGDGDMLVHETLPKLLQDVICRVEIEKVAKKDMLLAHLYFLQHKYRIKDTMVKHCDEMEKTMNLTKINNEVVNGIVPPDLNDECDLVSSYECLKISRYVNMMKELNTSLDLIHKWLSKNLPEDESERERLFKLLANIGHEYSLHNQSTKSLEAWELALKISKTPLQKLEATSFIIELADIQKPLVENLMKEAEKNIDLLKSNKKSSELITYFICKAEAYFYVDFQKSYDSFMQALEIRKEYNCSEILKARIYFMEHKFITLPCKYGVDGHREYTLVKIHQANNFANRYYTENSNVSSYDMRIFFEIYETLAKMYHDLRLPREVRCYARDAVVIAQKMLLPLRTMCLLYYLAYADINTCRLDDGRVKIKDLCDILGLSKTKVPINVPYEPVKNEEGYFEELVEGFKEIVLDVPMKVARPTSSGSPSFSDETFKKPTFLTHGTNCDCFYCTCIEYHQFVLKKTFLHGLLYMYESNPALGENFYRGCFNIYESLKLRESLYTTKLSRKISTDFIPKVNERLVETYCLAKYEYGNALIHRNLLDYAKNVNKEVLQLLEKFNYRFIHLYNETLAQKLDIIVQSLSVKQTEVKVNVVRDESDVKTPPSQKSEILISPMYPALDPIDPIKVIPKSLKFDLSDTEEDLEDKTKKLPHFLASASKTPAPSSSKIKVYTNKSTTKKPKNRVLLEIPPFKESVDGEKVREQLASRTKLLTDRLKNSSQKSSITNENLKRSAMKTGVRQNLLSQLTNDDDTTEPSENVRRSVRKRK